MREIYSLLLLAGLSQPILARPSPAIDIHGSAYQSVCSDREWKKLQEALVEAAGEQKPEALVRVADVYLCGAGKQATKELSQYMPRRIAVLSEETGTVGVSRRFLSRDEITPLRGRAWGAVVTQTENGVNISYYPNEACAASVTFAFKQDAWLLVGHGEACD